jgi:cytochrome c-type biogenesis protein CcmH/NrfG
LPAGHPGLTPSPAVDALVVKAQKQAERNAAVVEAWNRYGDLAMRFAMFNPANFEKARDAFAHVLKLDPYNREALRGIGDVYFDLRQYPKAVDA